MTTPPQPDKESGASVGERTEVKLSNTLLSDVLREPDDMHIGYNGRPVRMHPITIRALRNV